VERLRLGTRVCECLEGDITEQDTDAIVNAANNHLWMGAGVAGAIKRKGGQDIEEEAVRRGPIAVGDVVVTSAGSLRAQRVIHAACMGQDLRTDRETIRRATFRSLHLAEELRLRSISFPALGTGVGGFPTAECARVMLTEAVEFLKTAKTLELVRFVLFGKESAAAFDAELRNIRERLTSSGSPPSR